MNGTISFSIYVYPYLHMFGMTLSRDDEKGGGWSCQLDVERRVRGDQKRKDGIWRDT